MPHRWLVTFALIPIAIGCSRTPDSSAASTAEADVRAVVKDVQAAIKGRDGERLWKLLDSKSQTDIDQAATAVRSKYKAADAAGKTALEMEYGLSAEQVRKLDGPAYMRTGPFRKKYLQLADGTITQVEVFAKNATVYYTEPGGDKEKLDLAQRDGDWKVQLMMPK